MSLVQEPREPEDDELVRVDDLVDPFTDYAAGLMATDGFDNFQAQHFDVLAELSAMTGVDQLPSEFGPPPCT